MCLRRAKVRSAVSNPRATTPHPRGLFSHPGPICNPQGWCSNSQILGTLKYSIAHQTANSKLSGMNFSMRKHVGHERGAWNTECNDFRRKKASGFRQKVYRLLASFFKHLNVSSSFAAAWGIQKCQRKFAVRGRHLPNSSMQVRGSLSPLQQLQPNLEYEWENTIFNRSAQQTANWKLSGNTISKLEKVCTASNLATPCSARAFKSQSDQTNPSYSIPMTSN